MKLIKYSLVAAAALTFSTMATAEIKPYVGLNLGNSNIKASNKTDRTSFSENMGLGGSLSAGVMFNKYIGAEMDYYYFGSKKYNDGSTQYPNIQTKDSSDAFGGAVKGVYPIENSGFSIYGKLGYAKASTNSISTGSDAVVSKIDPVKSYNYSNSLMLTGGVQYQLDTHLGFNVQYDWLQGKVNQTLTEGTYSFTSTKTLISAGVNYLF